MGKHPGATAFQARSTVGTATLGKVKMRSTVFTDNDDILFARIAAHSFAFRTSLPEARKIRRVGRPDLLPFIHNGGTECTEKTAAADVRHVIAPLR